MVARVKSASLLTKAKPFEQPSATKVTVLVVMVAKILRVRRSILRCLRICLVVRLCLLGRGSIASRNSI